MTYKHIKSENIQENDYGSILVKNLFFDNKHKDFSVAEVKIKGKQKLGLNTGSNTAYYVLEGEGKFYIEDNDIKVNKGDLVFIPKNTKYRDEGNLILLAISTPMFDRDKHERFD